MKSLPRNAAPSAVLTSEARGLEWLGRAFGSPVLQPVAWDERILVLPWVAEDDPTPAAAERLGLSAKTCSYHLGLLGKYGLAEETGGGRGRARPWRLVPQGIGYTPSAGDEPAEAETQDAFARTVLDRDARIVRTFIDRRHRLPDAWRGRSAMSSNPLRLTAEQLSGLRDELAGVLERYLRLSSDPAPGAVPVHAAVYAVLSDVDAVEEDG